MTSHELARLLLRWPDRPVTMLSPDSSGLADWTEVHGVSVRSEGGWWDGARWCEGGHVELHRR